MIKPKNQTQYLLLSIIRNCETPIKQTHTKPQKTLDFKVNKSKGTIYFTPPISVEGSWMIGLTNLEVYISIFNINTTYSKFEHYTYTYDKFSFTELKDEFEEILNFSDITPYHLQREKNDHVFLKHIRN